MGDLDLIHMWNQMGGVARGVAFVLFFMAAWALRANSPCLPLTLIVLPETLTSTPSGTATGLFPIRDMVVRFQISNLRFEISDFRFQILEDEPWI